MLLNCTPGSSELSRVIPSSAATRISRKSVSQSCSSLIFSATERSAAATTSLGRSKTFKTFLSGDACIALSYGPAGNGKLSGAGKVPSRAGGDVLRLQNATQLSQGEWFG